MNTGTSLNPYGEPYKNNMTYLDKWVEEFEEKFIPQSIKNYADRINIEELGVPIVIRDIKSFLLTSLKEYGDIREKEGQERVRKEIEQIMTNNILYIGNELPQGMEKDTRDKYVLLGKPSDLLSTLTPDEKGLKE